MSLKFCFISTQSLAIFWSKNLVNHAGLVNSRNSYVFRFVSRIFLNVDMSSSIFRKKTLTLKSLRNFLAVNSSKQRIKAC